MSQYGRVAGVAGRKSYHQNCPIARGLDVLGERWTLLILRELIGGARRYGDMRAALPGIATNLLADRLRGRPTRANFPIGKNRRRSNQSPKPSSASTVCPTRSHAPAPLATSAFVPNVSAPSSCCFAR